MAGAAVGAAPAGEAGPPDRGEAQPPPPEAMPVPGVVAELEDTGSEPAPASTHQHEGREPRPGADSEEAVLAATPLSQPEPGAADDGDPQTPAQPSDEPAVEEPPISVHLPEHLVRPRLEAEREEVDLNQERGTPAEGEQLDRRMEGVLSELERRYQGRQVQERGEEGRPEKPAGGSRRRRRPRRRT
jgi:hypothetical protein